jgi:hypothetical protein
LAQQLLQVQYLAVFQQPSSLEEDLVNTQQWVEDKPLFSLILFSILSGY